MEPKAIRIEQILYTYNARLIDIKNHYNPIQELHHTINLYRHKNSLKTKFEEINAEIQTLEKLGKINSNEYHDFINERKTLLTKQEEILEEIEERELAKKEADKKIEKEQKELRGELKALLTQELFTIKRNINTSKPNDSNLYQKFIEDLLKAQTLCENTLRKIEDAEKKEQHSDTFILTDDLLGTSKEISSKEKASSNPEITDDLKENSINPHFPETRKQPKKSNTKKTIKIPSFRLYDDLEGTDKYIYYSRRKNPIPKSEEKTNNSKKSDFKVFDDMEIAHQEYQDMHCDKKIYAYISQKNQMEDKKFAIPISSINEDKKTIYKRADIDKICEEVAGGGIIGRLNRLYLSRKLNPNTIKILDRIGNYKMIRDYIESLYFNTNFLFDLSYDLRDLNAIQKWKFQKFTKAEEKSGVKIIGKLFNKNNSLLESPKPVIDSKDRKAFTERTKADGRNEEVAKNFFENSLSQDQQGNDELDFLDFNDPDSHDSH